MDGIGLTMNRSQARLDAAASVRQIEGLEQRQRSFAGVLARAGGDGASTAEATAKEAAQDFVAIALVQPLLAQLRSSNRAAPPFAPGPAEKQFGAIADAEAARRIVRKSGFPLVDRLASDLLHRSNPGGEA